MPNITFSLFKTFLIILVIFILLIVVMFKFTPKPMTYIAKKFIFDPTPNKKSPTSIDEIIEVINIDKDIEYTSKYSNNSFDHYYSKTQTEKQPVIIWLHGGGFVGGDKAMVSDYASIMASKNYTVIAANYATALNASYPTPILQVSELVNYLLINTEALKLDMNNIVFAGDSAGAQIVSQYVISQTNENYNPSFTISMDLVKSDIKGMLLYCGIYDIADLQNNNNKVIDYVFKQLGWAYMNNKDWINSDVVNEASIFNNISKDFPKSYITDGNKLSFENSAKMLIAKLSENNIEYKERFFDSELDIYHEFQFNLASKEGNIVLEDSLEFLSLVFK